MRTASPGFVAGAVQVLDHVLAQVVANRVGAPLGAVEQVLHAVRIRLASPLRDRSAVLARQVRKQPEYQPPHPAPGFGPHEPARNPVHQALEGLLPRGRVYAETCCHHMIVCLRTPMINGGRTHVRTGPCQQDHDLRLDYQSDCRKRPFKLAITAGPTALERVCSGLRARAISPSKPGVRQRRNRIPQHFIRTIIRVLPTFAADFLHELLLNSSIGYVWLSGINVGRRSSVD